MNKITSILLGGTLMAAFTLPSFGAGPLTPPGTPGQPVADMPSLVEIKAAIDALAASSGGGLNGRTAIPAQTATYTIATPGNYVLTGNITVATGDGIVISASDVTLDLNGFTISSTAGTKGGNGVYLASAIKSVTVRNGRLSSGPTTGFLKGIVLDWSGGVSSGLTFEDLSLSNLSVRLTGATTSGLSDQNIVFRRLTISEGDIQLHSIYYISFAPHYDPFGTAIECQISRSTEGSQGNWVLSTRHVIHCTISAPNSGGGPYHPGALKVGCSPSP